jgi:hypothetical protein
MDDYESLSPSRLFWPRFVGVLPTQPTEDQITINLVALLVKDPVVVRRKIDLAAFLDWERERYPRL